MNDLYENFTYIPGVTDIHTTAGEALRLGRGVCQDYAHIMTAVLRYMGIPARYVNGLMIGEGYTHAWVEVYTDGGWYGLIRPITCILMIITLSWPMEEIIRTARWIRDVFGEMQFRNKRFM